MPTVSEFTPGLHLYRGSIYTVTKFILAMSELIPMSRRRSTKVSQKGPQKFKKVIKTSLGGNIFESEKVRERKITGSQRNER